MVGSQKILTVSYGTFSCTLEGFEDSFGTMKAIAEYFRDLAADDRYFGAEPPIPDAEMLARIAEREVSRRVEARTDATGIVLRVGKVTDGGVAVDSPGVSSASVDAAPPTPKMPPAPAVLPVAQRENARNRPGDDLYPMSGRGPITGAPAQVVPKPAPPVPDDSDSIAAKLQRIRAVVGKGSAGFVAADVVEDTADLSPFAAAAVPVMGPDVTDMQQVDPIGSSDVTVSTFDIAPESAMDGLVDEAMQPDTLSAMGPTYADSIADAVPEVETDTAVETQTARPPIRARVIKMRRADFERAVAAGALVEGAARHAATEETPDSGFARPTADGMTRDSHSADDLVADGLTGPAVDFVELNEFAQTDEMAALEDLARLDAVVEAPSGLSATEEAELLAELAALEIDAADAVTGPEQAVLLAEEEGDETRADDQDTVAAIPVEDTMKDSVESKIADTDTAQALQSIMEEMAQDDGAVAAPSVGKVQTGQWDSAEDEPDAETTDLAALAEVIRVAGLANAGATESGATDFGAKEAKDIPTAKEINLFAEDDSEDDEDVVDLDAFERAVQHGAKAVKTDARALLADDEAEDWIESHPHLRKEPDADEAALSRILTQTDVQLSQPEAKSRREAISQLKAAVAATEADRRMGEQKPVAPEHEAESLFRDDLQQVVRPRRPLALTADVRSERPRPAPLKLVASQRVDLPQTSALLAAPRPAGPMPIRPRRVTITSDAPVAPSAPATAQSQVPSAMVPSAQVSTSQATSFAEFAAEMGATGLGDLLEAAAAYTSFVEGVGDFSRPQILRKVNEMTTEQFSREDGLRSFGTLLREGRIMKVSNGRFMVNEETRFNPVRNAG